MSDINVKGLSELQAFLKAVPEKMARNVMRGALRAGAVIVQNEAKGRIHNESNQLSKGLKVSTRIAGNLVTASVKATGKHAFIGHMLEFTGAAKHVITAKNGKALEFGGHFVYRIEHPGFHAKPFMRPALDTRAAEATLAVGNYIKNRLETKAGLDTSSVELEVQP